MAEVQVLTTTKVTMSHTFVVDLAPTDADSGDVTWQLYHADGTAVAGPGGSGIAVHPGAPGLYTMALQAPSAPDAWTLTWTGLFGGATVTVTDVIDIVGGHVFDLATAIDRLGLAPSKYTLARLADTRIAVEREAEDIAGRAFVPRFARVELAGNNSMELPAPHLPIRKVRSVSVFGTQFSADQLAAVKAGEAGVLFYPGGWIWGFGSRNIVVEYEFGMESPPLYVRNAAIRRFGQVLSDNSRMIPGNAIQWTTQDGGVYRLSAPGVASTGDLDIDGAYLRAGYDGPV